MNFFRSMIMICVILMYAPVMMAAETGPATGIAAETMESGGYVYVKLENDVWIAANSFAVSKGDEIQYGGAMEMNDFHSKSLDKTFESILFVSEASLVSNDGADNSQLKKEAKPPPPSSIKKPSVVTEPEPGEIKLLANGKAIADIYAESEELSEQVISLNAKVIKVSNSIMGKNWVTLQDGTGTEPDNKLIATTQQSVSPGDIVIAKGTIKTNVDLGRGYFYKVLMEETTFSTGEN